MTDQPYGQLNMQEIDPLHGSRFFVRKRDGRREEFNEARILLAIESAFRATLGIEPNEPLRDVLQAEIKKLTDPIVQKVLAHATKGVELGVEEIQDAVEEQLMRAGHLSVARRYILYRDERRRLRMAREKAAVSLESPGESSPPKLPDQPRVQTDDVPSTSRWTGLASDGAEEGWSVDRLINECLEQENQGAKNDDWANTLERAARSKISREPAYERVAVRLLLTRIYRQSLPQLGRGGDNAQAHRRQFRCYMTWAVESRQLAPVLLNFDLDLLAAGLVLERDELFGYQGLQALYDQYLLREEGQCAETPQYLWMRLAMGLALSESEPSEALVLEFYDALSTFRFIPSAAILLNAGTAAPHLTTCYAAGGWSDLEHITASPGGRVSERQRRGLTCDWLEPWHINITDFLTYPRQGEDPWQQDLGKGIWIPDLFMRRVQENKQWTLFHPRDVPDLHQLFGRAFERRYRQYEEQADRGELETFSRVPAQAIWAEILGSICQTGQPWLGFKDAANARSTQDVAGVIHSANLCGDILLPTTPNRAAACSVGAVNLAAHVTAGDLDDAKLQRTVTTAMRMLDNVFEISLYPDRAAQLTGIEQRPIALGIAGFQDMLHQLRLSYSSSATVELADRSMEAVSYFAIMASAALARERGVYPGYEKSKWKLGLLPIDTLALLEHERGTAVDVDRSSRRDWTIARQLVRKHGMRNCATTGITPIHEGAAIADVAPAGEPAPWLGVGELVFGQPAQWNACLVANLKGLNLWNNEVIGQLHNSQCSIQNSNSIPASLKEVYRTAFEIDPCWLIECAARRQKWLDMSQALTLYTSESDPRRLSEIFLMAWQKGLKSSRQLAATYTTVGSTPAPVAQPSRKRSSLEPANISKVATAAASGPSARNQGNAAK